MWEPMACAVTVIRQSLYTHQLVILLLVREALPYREEAVIKYKEKWAAKEKVY